MIRFCSIPICTLRRYGQHNLLFHKELVGCKVLLCHYQIILSSQHCCRSFNHLAGNSPSLLVASSGPLKKFQSTRAVAAHPKTGVLSKVLKKLGWMEYSRTQLMRSGYYLYETVADQINYTKFFQEFKLDDTFYSWFLITELHVWMLLVRVMAEGEEGRLLRNRIVGAMWEDVNTRAKKLGASNPSNVKVQLRELADQFQAAIIGYDEGLLTDDKVLAGAIWRRFFQQKCDNPEDVECLVKYIRRQVKLLDELPRDDVLLAENVSWLELERIISR